MTRNALLLALLLGALPTAAGSAAPRKARAKAVKVAVLPFQAVAADVPARAGLRLMARLVSEVHTTDGLALAEPPPPSIPEAPAESLVATGATGKEATVKASAESLGTSGATGNGATAKTPAGPSSATGTNVKEASLKVPAESLSAMGASVKEAHFKVPAESLATTGTPVKEASFKTPAESLATTGPPVREATFKTPSEALATARAAVKEATAAREARDFARADAALGRALDAYAAGAAQLTDAAELADAYALRAVVRYATGRDEQAAASLTHALAVAPDRDVPLAATSALFAKTVERVRAAWEAQPSGGVRFESVPPGLAVTLDGQPVGTAPVRVMDVPPGAHLWRAVLPSGEPVGGVVEVAPDTQAVVTVRPEGPGPDAALARALAANRLDAAAIEAASALGRAAGASLVVLGTVSREDSGLAVDAFVLAPGDTTPRRLPRLSVDADLLESGLPLRGWTTALAAKGLEAGVAEAVPTEPAADAAFASLPTQVVYPAAPARAPAEVKPAAPAPDRKPLGPNRKPLVRP